MEGEGKGEIKSAATGARLQSLARFSDASELPKCQLTGRVHF